MMDIRNLTVAKFFSVSDTNKEVEYYKNEPKTQSKSEFYTFLIWVMLLDHNFKSYKV